jgi:hypothetical protein
MYIEEQMERQEKQSKVLGSYLAHLLKGAGSILEIWPEQKININKYLSVQNPHVLDRFSLSNDRRKLHLDFLKSLLLMLDNFEINDRIKYLESQDDSVRLGSDVKKLLIESRQVREEMNKLRYKIDTVLRETNESYVKFYEIMQEDLSDLDLPSTPTDPKKELISLIEYYTKREKSATIGKRKK